jgi:hypothetical protein
MDGRLIVGILKRTLKLLQKDAGKFLTSTSP